MNKPGCMEMPFAATVTGFDRLNDGGFVLPFLDIHVEKERFVRWIKDTSHARPLSQLIAILIHSK